jgi:hypothetical protein
MSLILNFIFLLLILGRDFFGLTNWARSGLHIACRLCRKANPLASCVTILSLLFSPEAGESWMSFFVLVEGFAYSALVTVP